MIQRLIFVAVVLALMLAALAVVPQPARAEDEATPAPQAIAPPNYYVPPGTPAGTPAALYPSPRPVPPLVGRTYITYPPLAPHEFLYPHHRVYVRDNGGSKTRTSVTWSHRHPWPPYVTWGTPSLHSPPAYAGPPAVH